MLCASLMSETTIFLPEHQPIALYIVNVCPLFLYFAVQSKYVGTGHSDTNKYEWLANQHRDSSASFMGHPNLLAYFAIAENDSVARVRFNLLKKMLQPCGPPPEKGED
eukprot:Opistho-2@5564